MNRQLSTPEQWTFNAALLLFMSIAVPIAVVLVALSIGKTFLTEAAAPAPDRRVSDALDGEQ
jgi:hypothetical protein